MMNTQEVVALSFIVSLITNMILNHMKKRRNNNARH